VAQSYVLYSLLEKTEVKIKEKVSTMALKNLFDRSVRAFVSIAFSVKVIAHYSAFSAL